MIAALIFITLLEWVALRCFGVPWKSALACSLLVAAFAWGLALAIASSIGGAQ